MGALSAVKERGLKMIASSSPWLNVIKWLVQRVGGRFRDFVRSDFYMCMYPNQLHNYPMLKNLYIYTEYYVNILNK